MAIFKLLNELSFIQTVLIFKRLKIKLRQKNNNTKKTMSLATNQGNTIQVIQIGGKEQNTNQEEDNESTSGLREEDIILLVIIVGFALAIGSLGYYYTSNLSLLDSFYTSSFILSGMGPPTIITTVAGKFFASFYAIFSAFVFIIVVTIFIERLVSSDLS